MKKLHILFLIVCIVVSVTFTSALLTARFNSNQEQALNRLAENAGYSGYYTLEQVYDLLIDDDGRIEMLPARTALVEFLNYGAVSGKADSIHLTFSPVFDSLQTGMTLFFIADSANTGATTLNVDALAEKNIYEAHDKSALEANDIKAGMPVMLMYDGTQWQQMSQSGN